MFPSAVWWGLRSPGYGNNNGFVIVWTDGDYGNGSANYSGGLRPGFCKYTRSNGVAETRLLDFR